MKQNNHHRWVVLRSSICLVVVSLLSACSLAPTPAAQTTASVVQNLPLIVVDSSPTPFAPQPPTETYIPTPLPSPTITPSPTAEPEITLLFTGVIVPARCVQAGIDARGNADYLFEEVKDYISAADLAVGTINATISDATPHTGCVVTYMLVGDTRSAVAMKDAGFDLMSAATNHIKNCSIPNCGDRAFLDTLDSLRANGITPIGAGNDLEEALQPVVVEVQGVRFGFVSLGMVEPMAFAGEDSPGIAILNDENLRSSIAAAREVSDVVIAMPHWGPEDVPEPNPYQQEFAQVAVDAGADLVVGNHTHVVQAIQSIAGIDVFYGLGNFVFDQTWDLAHQQGVILIVHFKGTHYEGYDLIPTHVDGDGMVHIAGSLEAAEILQRIEAASDRLR